MQARANSACALGLPRATGPGPLRIAAPAHWRVYRGQINPHDIGLFQINEVYHAAEAKHRGLDIFTLAGNIAYARVLYDRNGTHDWNWSRLAGIPSNRAKKSCEELALN